MILSLLGILAFFFEIGNTSEIYQHGTMYVFTALSYCLVIPITAHLYMPVFYRSEVLTCYEVNVESLD